MIFASVGCDCDPEGVLVCGDDEHSLRMIAGGSWPHGAMTIKQREWCVDEANRHGEGYYSKEELSIYDDADLARAVLNAWNMYINSNCR